MHHLCTILHYKTEWAYSALLLYQHIVLWHKQHQGHVLYDPTAFCPLACQPVLRDTGMCTKPHLLRIIDLFISQLASARISHVGLQALNQTDMRTWHRLLRPIRTLAACRCSPVCAPGCDFLRVETAQETSGGRMSVGVISTLLGPAELSGFFLPALCERCFVCWGPQAAGGVEGRDAEKEYHYETAVMLLAL